MTTEGIIWLFVAVFVFFSALARLRKAPRGRKVTFSEAIIMIGTLAVIVATFYGLKILFSMIVK